jgi:hypothetical protein
MIMLFKQRQYSTPSRASSWSFAIAPDMQPPIFSSLSTSGRGCAASVVVPLFLASPCRPESSISAAEEWSAADNLLQKQLKQREPFEERAVGALLTAMGRDPNLNLKAKFCCRFAGAAIIDRPFNHLLRRRQPKASTGWPSIAAVVMLVRYRNWRRAAA